MTKKPTGEVTFREIDRFGRAGDPEPIRTDLTFAEIDPSAGWLDLYFYARRKMRNGQKTDEITKFLTENTDYGLDYIAKTVNLAQLHGAIERKRSNPIPTMGSHQKHDTGQMWHYFDVDRDYT